MTLAPDTFAYVAELVRRRSAIQLERGKEYLVESRLQGFARERGHVGVDALVREIRAAGAEGDAVRLVEAMTTNETSWFRDHAPFEALRDHVLPAVLDRRGPGARVRVWSAACSTGQEPYSIAMTCAESLPPAAGVDILATDLSEEVLARARTGQYSQLEINRGLPAHRLVRHLARVGAQWEVAPELRRQVAFVRHNLLDPPPPGPFDVVFLRNVLIYFDLPTKAAVLRRVRQVLAPGGVLVLGAAETPLGVDDGWQRAPWGHGWTADRPATDPVPLRGAHL